MDMNNHINVDDNNVEEEVAIMDGEIDEDEATLWRKLYLLQKKKEQAMILQQM
jgi:hypothetical protein